VTSILLRFLALAALLLFLFFGEAPERSRFWTAFFDAGHTPLFGVIALLLRSLLRRQPASPAPAVGRRPPVRAGLLAFALSAVLGLATELLQMAQRHGDPSVSDLLRDMAGAAAFLITGAVIESRARARSAAVVAGQDGAARSARLRWVGAAGLVAALLILVAAGRTFIVTSAAYVARDRAFPTLFALDGSWWERQFVDVGGNHLTPAAPGITDRAAAGERVSLARLDLRPGRYSGVTFAEPYPDWRGYQRLSFTIVSDLDAPLPMAIRIHDAAHDHRYADRFNRRLTIRPGANHIAIAIDDIRNAPGRRQMDVGRIRAILLFASGLTRRTHVYVSPLRLE
jgi:hypothetical protein